jgi:formylglycine-generating enzyme required for sulfatase activity
MSIEGSDSSAEIKSIPILDDSPAASDALDFEPYVLTIADLIKSQKTQTPLTIGVFGPWGSGKTSLLAMIRGQVEDDVYRTVWFNAWKYARDEMALWRALVIRTLDALRPRDPKNPGQPFKGDPADLSENDQVLIKELDRLEESVYRTVEWQELGGWNLDWPKALLGTVEGSAEIALAFVPGASGFVELFKKMREATGAEKPKISEAFKRQVSEFRREQLRSVEQFVHGFEGVVSQHLGGRLVVFIDDLDRCLPEHTIEVLEAIKLFLDVPGCVFLLAVDQRTIQEGIKRRYKDLPETIDGAAYLEKIVQLPFQLPPIAPGDMEKFVGSLVTGWPDERCAGVFVQGLGDNPRQVKRTINVFLLLWQLAERREKVLAGRIKPVRLAKVVVIQHVFPELYGILRENPGWLAELEVHFRSGVRKAGELEREEAYPLPPGLAEYANRAKLGNLLIMHPVDAPDLNFLDVEGQPLKPDELRLYFTLTRRAEAPEAEPAASGEPRARFEPQTILIPAGLFLMGSTPEQAQRAIEDGLDEDLAAREQPQHSVELSPYRIAKYPVTNLEYQAFVQAKEHRPPSHWEGHQYPEGKGDHPVVNVSWEDAVAYCQWLAETSGKPYRLPSEAEWEKAARGEDGRIYPWGDKWDQSRCNTRESGIGDTTSVRQYSPEGESPYGVADMVGNVWEWCADWFAEEEYQRRQGGPVVDPGGPDSGTSRVLRGGSFHNVRRYARCAYRRWNSPDLRYGDRGFRVALSPGNP